MQFDEDPDKYDDQYDELTFDEQWDFWNYVYADLDLGGDVVAQYQELIERAKPSALPYGWKESLMAIRDEMEESLEENVNLRSIADGVDTVTEDLTSKASQAKDIINTTDEKTQSSLNIAAKLLGVD